MCMCLGHFNSPYPFPPLHHPNVWYKHKLKFCKLTKFGGLETSARCVGPINVNKFPLFLRGSAFWKIQRFHGKTHVLEIAHLVRWFTYMLYQLISYDLLHGWVPWQTVRLAAGKSWGKCQTLLVASSQVWIAEPQTTPIFHMPFCDSPVVVWISHWGKNPSGNLT